MLSILFAFFTSYLASFYALQFHNIDGATVNTSSFQGKKVLLVNIATGSSRSSQLAGLQQLHQQYGDSLVIIAFPSNSFGNEMRTDSQIKQFCQSEYGVTFLIAAKNPVAGVGIQSVFHWLTTPSENGFQGQAAMSDYQKFLIDTDGSLIGVFAGRVEPLAPQLVQAIVN